MTDAIEVRFKEELANTPDPVQFAIEFPARMSAAIELAKTPQEANDLRALASMGDAYLRQRIPAIAADRDERFRLMHPTEEAYIRASARAGALWSNITPGRGGDRKSNKTSALVSVSDAGFKSPTDAATCMHVAELDEQDLQIYLDDTEEKLRHSTLNGAERVWRMLNAKPVEFEIEGMYRVWYADPPWDYGNQRGEGTTEQADHYHTMKTADICAIPVKEHALDDAVLFLWCTSPILYPDAFRVVGEWGFQYKSSFVWDKVKHNMGYYNSVRHEFLLIGTRGSCTPDVVHLHDSVQSIERSATHSEKPEEFRAIIDELYPFGARAELFARRQTEGWDCYGTEIS